MTIALSCYVLLPTGLALRPYRVYGSDIFARLVRMLYAVDTARNVCLTEEKCRKLLALAGTAEGSFSGSLHRDGTLYFCLLPYLCGMDAARGIQGSNQSAFYNCHLTQPVV